MQDDKILSVYAETTYDGILYDFYMDADIIDSIKLTQQISKIAETAFKN